MDIMLIRPRLLEIVRKSERERRETNDHCDRSMLYFNVISSRTGNTTWCQQKF